MSTGQWDRISSYGSIPSRANAQSYYSYHSEMGPTEYNQYRYLKRVQNAANLYRKNQRATAQTSLVNYGQRSMSQKRKSTRKQRKQINKTRRRRN